MGDKPGRFDAATPVPLGDDILEQLAEDDYTNETFTYQQGQVEVSFTVYQANDLGYRIGDIAVDCRALDETIDEYPNQVKGRMDTLKRSSYLNLEVIEKSWESVNPDALNPDETPLQAELVGEHSNSKVRARLSGVGQIRIETESDTGIAFTESDLSAFLDELGEAAQF